MQQDKVLPYKHIAIVLLLINGLLLSLMLALAKGVTALGIHPVVYAFWQSFLAGSLLLFASVSRRSVGKRPSFNRNILKYCFISGVTGIAVPNAIAFFLVNKLGSGFTGIMYALPPVFTFFLSILVGMTRFKVHKLLGLSIAVVACTWIVLERHQRMLEISAFWFALGIVIPIMLSIGNVYRAKAWPKGKSAMPLAADTLLSASFLLAVYTHFTGLSFMPDAISITMLSLISLQGLLTAATFLCSFELQKRSDPVFYSQLGSVAAVFGLLIGVLWFDERYSSSIWFGVLVLLAGLRINNLSTLSVKRTFIKSYTNKLVR